MALDDSGPKARRATLGLAAVLTAGVLAAGVGLVRSAPQSAPPPAPAAARHPASPGPPLPQPAFHEEVD
jgi:hypothetical protein